MQQNRVTVIRQLSVENLTQEMLKEVKICITTEPDFGNVTPIVIETLAAGHDIGAMDRLPFARRIPKQESGPGK